MHPLIHEVIRNLVILLFERLNDELTVDQIFESRFTSFLDLFPKLFAGVLRAQ